MYHHQVNDVVMVTETGRLAKVREAHDGGLTVDIRDVLLESEVEPTVASIPEPNSCGTRQPIITLDYNEAADFEGRCQELINEGYRCMSCQCGFIDSENYNFILSFQAIFILPEFVA